MNKHNNESIKKELNEGKQEGNNETEKKNI